MITATEALREAEHAFGEIKAAFGAPGDHGYSTPEGKALFTAYKALATIRSVSASPVPTGEPARPLMRPFADSGEPEWQQIVSLFNRYNTFPPGTRLRDELVVLLEWARYGEKCAAIPLVDDTSIAGVWKQAQDNHAAYSDTGGTEGDIRFHSLGLAGEVGEVMELLLPAVLLATAQGKVANFVKKRWRDGSEHEEAIKDEVADVSAYTFMLAAAMGMTPATLIARIAHKQAVFISKMKARDAALSSPSREKDGGQSEPESNDLPQQLIGRAQFLEDARSEVKTPGLLRQAASAVNSHQGLVEALRPLISAARKRQAHWESMTAAVSDAEEASWMGKAEWWKRLADAGDNALSKLEGQS